MVARWLAECPAGMQWLLKDPKSAQHLINKLLTPMGKSKVFEASRVAGTSTNTAKSEEPPPAKKRRNVAPKAGSKALAQETFIAKVDTAAGPRDLMFCDDAVNAIHYVIGNVKQPKEAVISFVFASAIEFGMLGFIKHPRTLENTRCPNAIVSTIVDCFGGSEDTTATPPGILGDGAEESTENKFITFKTWRTLRKFLKKVLVRSHALCPRMSDPDQVGMEEEDDDADGPEDGCEDVSEEATASSKLQDPKALSITIQFLESNPYRLGELLYKTHASFAKALSVGLSSLVGADGTSVLATSTDAVAQFNKLLVSVEVAFKSIHLQDVCFFLKALHFKFTSVDSTYGNDFQAFCIGEGLSKLVPWVKTEEQLMYFCRIRMMYALRILKEMVETLADELSEQVKLHIQRLAAFCKASVDAVSALDLSCEVNDWIDTWTRIAKRAQELHTKAFVKRTGAEWKDFEEKTARSAKSLKAAELAAVVVQITPDISTESSSCKLLDKATLMVLFCDAKIQEARAQEVVLEAEWSSLMENFCGDVINSQTEYFDSLSDNVEEMVSGMVMMKDTTGGDEDGMVGLKEYRASVGVVHLSDVNIGHHLAALATLRLQELRKEDAADAGLDAVHVAAKQDPKKAAKLFGMFDGIGSTKLVFTGRVVASFSADSPQRLAVHLGRIKLEQLAVHMWLLPHPSVLEVMSASWSPAWSVQRVKVNEEDKGESDPDTWPTMKFDDFEFTVNFADKVYKLKTLVLVRNDLAFECHDPWPKAPGSKRFLMLVPKQI
jgi:hypothetical protein